MQKLPIDQILPQLHEMIDNCPAVVVKAPPGTGKTTRIPLALLKNPSLKDKKIIMLEPRRLAAVNAARWMASLLGEEVGRTVGYAIRFERKVSASTCIEVVTEGILARRMQSDPFLEGVGLVIFDEFHERSLHTDLALALCRDVQKGGREDLKLLIMSATLECGPIAEVLGNTPVLYIEGECFPVDIHYLARDFEGEIALEASMAVANALRETDGDILLFLPGSGDIRRCQRLLENRREMLDSVDIHPLYGDLPFAAQERAIAPGKRRRVVLATNIAETSLTIDGIRTVIDSGFSKQLRFDPATGLNRLVTLRISAASAAQRAGRAGRVGPGVCYRLWSRHTQNILIPFTQPEVLIADLTSLVLQLAEWGVNDPRKLTWVDPLPFSSFAEGRLLLERFGALDDHGLITHHGKRMASLTVHPRLAHMLLVSQEKGEGALAADLAALLGERDIFRGDAEQVYSSSSDLLDRVESLREWRGSGREVGEKRVDTWLCKIVDRSSKELRSRLGIKDDETLHGVDEVGILLAHAFPERIARQREPGSDRYLLVNGKGGRLSPRSAVRDQPFLVAVSMDGGERGDGMIHQASALTLKDMRKEFGNEFRLRRKVEWDRKEGRIVAVDEEYLGELVVATKPVVPRDEEVLAAVLEGVKSIGLVAFKWTEKAFQFRARIALAGRLFPEEEWPDLSDRSLIDGFDDWLSPCLRGIRTLTDLFTLDILPPLKGILTQEQNRRLDEGFPTQLTVPSGSRISLCYSMDGPPVLAVKLQELFGLAETPAVAWGKAPLLLHLLSPAGRPIQVTSDLSNFWNEVYPEVKRELKGRYPKHPWPDDPWSAAPTRHVKKRVWGKG